MFKTFKISTLEFGIYLELGHWNLEFLICYNIPHDPRRPRGQARARA